MLHPTGATGRENQVAERILDGAFKVQTTLGPGLLESVDEHLKNGLKRLANALPQEPGEIIL